MSHPQPIPQDDDQTPAELPRILYEAIAAAHDGYQESHGPKDDPDDYTGPWRIDGDIDLGTMSRSVVAKLKSAGYELVNQVGEYWPTTTLMEPEEFDALKAELDEEDALTPIESIAQWLGERESTHLWPEIHESDKACYRDAARDLITTIGGVGEYFAGVLETFGGVVDLTGSLLGEALAPRLAKGTVVVAVQLPEPDVDDNTWSGPGLWLVRAADSEVRVDSSDGKLYGFEPDGARNLAAELMAAAAKVEAGE